MISRTTDDLPDEAALHSGGAIWIVGAGGVGTVLAARLERGRPGRVTLVDAWPENVHAIREHGLTVDYPDETVHARPTALLTSELDHATDAPQLAVLAVKAYDTPAMLEAVVPFIGEAPMLSLQNSINEEQIAAAIGEDRTIGGVCLYDGALVSPGHGAQAMAHGKIVIGELDGQIMPRTEQVAEALRASTPVRISNDIWGELWTKLIRNAMVNAIAAVTDLGMGQLVLVPGCDRICIALGSEAVRVAVTQGINVSTADLFDCPYDYPAEWYLTDADSTERTQLEASFHDSWTPHPTVFPSLLQDLRKGRKTEVEALNGYVTAKAAELGLSAPLNAAITEMVLECSETGRFPDRRSALRTLLSIVT